MDLKQVFRSINTQMLEDFEHFSSQIKHRGERGTEREEILATFLRTYLPTRYALSRGEIIDTAQQTTRQCDLVIYDHLNCPMLLAGHGYRVFPAEPVYAVIEVKSILNRHQLEDAVGKIKSVKNLKRDNGIIAGIVFAYKAGWRNDPLEKAAKALLELCSTIDPTQYIDLICILDAGVIYGTGYYGWAGVPKDFSDVRQLLAFSPDEVSPLLWFFINLLPLLDDQTAEAGWPNLYLPDPEIGRVTVYEPYGPDAKQRF